MDNRGGILFAQKLGRRSPTGTLVLGTLKRARSETGAPFLATVVAAAKLSAMTAPAINGLKQLLATAEPPELGPKPRANVLSEAILNAKLDSWFRETNSPLQQQPLIRSLVLLWHDHLDAAHTLAQGIENPDGSFVHAIMHRREPDYANAKYWWRRVGAHPAFPEIARRVGELLKARGAGELAAKLLPGGQWDPDRFCGCVRAGRKPEASPKQTEWLRAVQRVETEVLLDYFCHD